MNLPLQSFKSKPIKIDFIAYHDLQAQSAYSLFDLMSTHFECKWLIGPNQQPTGAEAAIFLDHIGYHPELRKSPGGYKYLFHMSHDLGDVTIYEDEAERLSEFDIIFTPSYLHTKNAQKTFGDKKIIIETGWAKYERMDLPEAYHELKSKIASLPYEYTVLYTPGFAWTYEWKYLFPLLKNLSCNFIVKNAPYINKDQAFPIGQEEEYKQHIDSTIKMEELISSYNLPNMLVCPREINVCSLFPFADVLISDQSSTLLEFLPYGTSIETGRYDPDETNFNPVISQMLDDVNFLDKDKLCSLLSSFQDFEKFIIENKSKKRTRLIKYPNDKITVSQLTSLLIDNYIVETNYQPFIPINLNPSILDRYYPIKKIKNNLIRNFNKSRFIKYNEKLNLNTKMAELELKLTS